MAEIPFDVDTIHEAVSDALDELAASYALRALNPAEQARFGLHIQRCRVCAGLVAEYTSVADALPDALPPAPANPALKARIFAAAERDMLMGGSNTKRPVVQAQTSAGRPAGRNL